MPSLDLSSEEDAYFPPDLSSEEEDIISQEFHTSEEEPDSDMEEILVINDRKFGKVKVVQDQNALNGTGFQDQTQNLFQNQTESFYCPNEGCLKSFATKRRLSRHLLTHSGRRPFACTHEGCFKTFIRKEHYTRHLVVHQDTLEGKRPYACHVEGCSSRYAYKAHLKRHLLTHEKKKPWKVDK